MGDHGTMNSVLTDLEGFTYTPGRHPLSLQACVDFPPRRGSIGLSCQSLSLEAEVPQTRCPKAEDSRRRFQPKDDQVPRSSARDLTFSSTGINIERRDKAWSVGGRRTQFVQNCLGTSHDPQQNHDRQQQHRKCCLLVASVVFASATIFERM